MVDIFISGENIAIPPRIDTYEKVAENVFVSKLHQGAEREENIRLATFLAKNTNEPVFVLPIIEPLQQNAELRKSYFPNGVKDKKNPDFYFRGRFVDGKSMNDSELSDEKHAKRNIQNRIADAFDQANDAYIEIPTTFYKSWILSAVYGKLNSSKHFHIVFIKYGNELITIKKPDK